LPDGRGCVELQALINHFGVKSMKASPNQERGRGAAAPASSSARLLRTAIASAVLVGAGALAIGHATAQSTAEPGAHAGMWQRFDADGNGQISRAEFEQGQQRAIERRMQQFDRADADGDGNLSQKEMLAWRDSMRSGMSERGKHGPAAGGGTHGGMRGDMQGGMQRGMHGGMPGGMHGGMQGGMHGGMQGTPGHGGAGDHGGHGAHQGS
jgi:hypothetical protein